MTIWKKQLAISVIRVFLNVLPLKKRDRHLAIIIKFKNMNRKTFCLTLILFVFLGLLSIPKGYAETIRIFTNSDISQYAHAAEKIKIALESNNIKAEIVDIQDLSTNFRNRFIVLTDKDDLATANLYMEEVGDVFEHLDKQAFAIQTMLPAKSYWIFGGDVTGAMYGGLQLAEYILLNGSDIIINEEQTPDILNRGIKFNLPFDKRSPTYYSSGFSENDFRGTSTRNAVKHVWEISFWADMFDELAQNRYNAFTMWTLHPFTSMIQLPDYPDVAIQNIEGFDGFSKGMSMDEKIEFWKQVMEMAKNRGIDFYIYTWNIYTYGATGKYGIDNDGKNPETTEYMRKCMNRLFETYPDLTGFGVTSGENMPGISNREKALWTWETYGKGLYDYARLNPRRNIVFVHRYHTAGGEEVADNFRPLIDLPNVRFDFSFKYAVAHTYSTTSPNWIRSRQGDVPAQLIDLNMKTWVELRNDDFYYLHWGDPGFVRRYLASLPEKEHIIRGFVMGSDGYTPTYVFSSKADWATGKLDMQRTWYTWMLWGRLSYNPDIQDEYFQDILKQRYPESKPESLFKSWSHASQGIPMFTELIQGTLISDFLWYPEMCISRRYGFITIDKMAETVPPPGSNLCSIAESAVSNCGDKKSSYQVADEIEYFAMKALELTNNEQTDINTELGTNMGNIRAMAYLSLYFAEKTRGATYKAATRLDLAKTAMGKAYGYWIQYVSLMDTMYTGQDFQRTNPLTGWHMMDEEVANEYIRLGGSITESDE
jgi:hypothetical protein